MATRTITVDFEAYERLKMVQKPGESFSETIKGVVRRPFDYDGWLKKIQANRLSKEAAAAIEEAIASRTLPSSYDQSSGGR